jgi:hypothetical protein
MNRKDMVWVKVKKPIKISQSEKFFLTKRIETEIAKTTKIQQSVSRIEIRAGRVYLYKLYERIRVEGVTYRTPLIDGKYLEFPLVRITIYDKRYHDCSLDWQRYNNQWMALDEGSLEECIQKAEQSDWVD